MRLPRGVLESPSLEVLKKQLAVVLRDNGLVGKWWYTDNWIRWSGGLFQHGWSYDSMIPFSTSTVLQSSSKQPHPFRHTVTAYDKAVRGFSLRDLLKNCVTCLCCTLICGSKVKYTCTAMESQRLCSCYYHCVLNHGPHQYIYGFFF